MGDICIYKTIYIPLKCNSSDYAHLCECNKLSAQVWNLCLLLDKEFHETNGKFIQRSDLQKLTKKCVPLHSKGIHHVVHKYLFARDSSFQSLKKGIKKVRLPYREKRFFTTGWDSQSIKVDYEKGIIILSKPEILVDGKTKRQKSIVCFGKEIPKNIVEIELIYKERFYLAIKFKEDIEFQQIKTKNCASIDLGEIHSVVSIDSSGNAIIITGRKLREIKAHRNRHQSRIQQRIGKCKKGSTQYWHYKRSLRNLQEKTKRKIRDIIHKSSKLFLEFCLEKQISTVYYGDLDSATRNTRLKKKGNKILRRKLSQWCYGQLMLQLENKLRKHGIKLIKVKEYYTSVKCPCCKKRNRVKNRNYSCECGYAQHRDIVGAINILNDNAGTDITHYITKKYLQIA